MKVRYFRVKRQEEAKYFAYKCVLSWWGAGGGGETLLLRSRTYTCVCVELS